MIKYEQDPDVVRWGLQLFDTDPYPNYGCYGSILQQNIDYFPGHYLKEYNCGTESSNTENHDLSANCLQEELLRLSVTEQSKSFQEGVDHSQTSFYSPNWFEQSPGTYTFGNGNCQEETTDLEVSASYSSPGGESYCGEEWSYSLDLMDGNALDSELGKKLNQMVPIPVSVLSLEINDPLLIKFPRTFKV